MSSTHPDDAVLLLAPEVESLYQQEFTVVLDGDAYAFTPADLGLVYDSASVLQHIMQTGQNGNYDIAVSIDPVQFQRHFDSLGASLPNRATNAEVVIDGTNARVVPSVDGNTLDAVYYRSEILANAMNGDSTIEITTAFEAPEITTEEAQLTADQANLILERPLVFSAGEESWELDPSHLAAAMVITPDGEGALEINWDIDPLRPHIDEIVADIEGQEATDAWIQDLGTHSWLVPEQSSLTVDRKGLLEQVNSTLIDGETQIEVPVAIISANKSSEDVMEELGITGIIASGDSVYTGSGIGRTHNIETAAYYIDRTLVPPGGSYSFNDSVGSLFNGEYMDAGSYIDGPNGTSLAGGVCQVSTTVFRAALNAGFPITERWPHSYRSPFYELGGWSPGFDAAIVQDSIVPHESTDMRFTNPTDSWLMITAEVDGDRLVVDIWGEETGFAVSFSEPDVWVAYSAPDSATVMVDAQLQPGTMEQQEPLDGLGVSVTRYVHDKNGTLVYTDTWQTTYYATGPIMRVSPDMEDEAYKLASGGP